MIFALLFMLATGWANVTPPFLIANFAGPTALTATCSDANLNACGAGSALRVPVIIGKNASAISVVNSTYTCTSMKADYLDPDGVTWDLGGVFTNTSGTTATSQSFTASSASTTFTLAPPSGTTTAFQIRCALGVTGSSTVTGQNNLETISVTADPLTGYAYAAAGNVTNGCGSNGLPACYGTGVWQSQDCGASWHQQSTGTNASALATGDPWSMRIASSGTTIFIANGYGAPASLFRSTDSGVNFTDVHPDVVSGTSVTGGTVFVQAIAMDPTDSTHVAVSFHVDCVTPHNPVCFTVTTDSGATWSVIEGPPALTDWIEAASLTICGSGCFMYTGSAAFVTTNSGSTWTNVINLNIFGSYAGGAWTTGAGNHYLGINNSGVWTSSSWASGWGLLANSPGNSTVIIDDGTTMFTSFAGDTGGTPQFEVALSSLGSTWTHDSAAIPKGAYEYAVDPVHNVVYGAFFIGGVWRYTSGSTSGCPAPAISGFTATPGTIVSGGSTQLVWTIPAASSSSIDHSVGSVLATSGSVVVTGIGSDTTYTLSSTNINGTSTASTTVHIGTPAQLPAGLKPIKRQKGL